MFSLKYLIKVLTFHKECDNIQTTEKSYRGSDASE